MSLIFEESAFEVILQLILKLAVGVVVMSFIPVPKYLTTRFFLFHIHSVHDPYDLSKSIFQTLSPVHHFPAYTTEVQTSNKSPVFVY